MFKVKIISVKATEWTKEDGSKAISYKCFIALENGDIGYIKTAIPVKTGDTVSVGFKCGKEQNLYPAIVEVCKA